MPVERQDDLEPVKFLKPPVQRVELTVFFAASGAVQASHVAPLRELWKASYPKVIERAPSPSDEVPTDRISLVDEESHWPIPYTKYSSAADRRSVAFQEDRFTVSWGFDEDSGTPYPGFDSLYQTMQDEFHIFSEVLSRSDLKLDIVRSTCRYVNQIQGLTGPQLAVGVLTGWKGQVDGEETDSDYVGVRLHSAEDNKRNCSSLVSVDANVGADPKLAIAVTHGGEVEGLAGIAVAHDELIDTFLRYTSPEQHDMWGRV